jgi:sugar/nucleoside kinase (ribokinase family)
MSPISLANYGCDAAFISKLPENPLGESARNALREYGVDVSKIVWGGDRLGIYYLESGVSMRPSKVVYDRAHSAIAEAVPSDFDFENYSRMSLGSIFLALRRLCPRTARRLPSMPSRRRRNSA